MMTCYDDAMRTIVDPPDQQLRGLAEYCAREKVSRAEAIRRAVDQLLSESEQERRRRIMREAFGAWKHLGIDTDTYLADIRSEWDERECELELRSHT